MAGKTLGAGSPLPPWFSAAGDGQDGLNDNPGTLGLRDKRLSWSLGSRQGILGHPDPWLLLPHPPGSPSLVLQRIFPWLSAQSSTTPANTSSSSVQTHAPAWVSPPLNSTPTPALGPDVGGEKGGISRNALFAHGLLGGPLTFPQIGRASCRERV